MPKSDLPFGSEFSPSQIDLRHVLSLAHNLGGNWRAFETSIRDTYFSRHNTNETNRGKLANNTKLGMIAYGIIDRDANLTEFGRSLYDLATSGDEPALYHELARHILLDLNGATLVQCVQDMHAAGEIVDLVRLREWLEDRGIHFPRGGKHPSIMRLWLEKAGVFVNGWRVDSARLESVMGLSEHELEVLAQLTGEQRSYLKTLANIGGSGPYASNEIEKLATATYGIKFNEKSLPKDVLKPLEAAGYITLERGTKAAGRGAKPAQVRATDKLQIDLVTPLLDQLDRQVKAELRPLLRKPLRDILADLTHAEKHIRGLALEALAFKLMRLIDLTYVATRLRGSDTGGAEVDLIFEGTRLVFSRWQIQCKNTASVSLDDVAKEVGLTHLLKSNVIVMVSTGKIGPEARRYANTIMAGSNLCVVMIDGADIVEIERRPAAITDILNRETAHAMRLKALDLKEA